MQFASEKIFFPWCSRCSWRQHYCKPGFTYGPTNAWPTLPWAHNSIHVHLATYMCIHIHISCTSSSAGSLVPLLTPERNAIQLTFVMLFLTVAIIVKERMDDLFITRIGSVVIPSIFEAILPYYKYKQATSLVYSHLFSRHHHSSRSWHSLTHPGRPTYLLNYKNTTERY